MKQNPICEETRRHRSLDEHENFTSSQLFWANKPAVVPEKLLFPLILRSTRTFLTHTYIFKLFLTLTLACCSYWIECVFLKESLKNTTLTLWFLINCVGAKSICQRLLCTFCEWLVLSLGKESLDWAHILLIRWNIWFDEEKNFSAEFLNTFLYFTLSGRFPYSFSDLRKTLGSVWGLASFELQAQSKHVGVILCSWGWSRMRPF